MSKALSAWHRENMKRRRALIRDGALEDDFDRLFEWAIDVVEKGRGSEVVAFAAAVAFGDGGSAASLHWPDRMGPRENAADFMARTLVENFPWLKRPA